MGYDLEEPEENGPSAAHPSRPLYSTFPWEEKIEGFAKKAQCDHKNWKHTCLKYTLGKGCATLALQKPGIDPSVLDALQDAVLDLQTQKDVRVVILRSDAGKLFCQGLDPKYILSESGLGADEIKANHTQLAKVLYFLSALPQIVIGLVQGSAMGAGVGLLCACDMVYTFKGAFFSMNEGKLGTTPSTSLPYIMRRIKYMADTRQLVLAGENFTANRAKEVGLVTEVYEEFKDVEAACTDLLTKMTVCAPSAVAATKEVVRNTLGQAPSSFMMNYVSTVLTASPEEGRRGVEAVQSKKKPAWAEVVISA
jgi:methylglutaconyl-CoA hydratase